MTSLLRTKKGEESASNMSRARARGPAEGDMKYSANIVMVNTLTKEWPLFTCITRNSRENIPVPSGSCS